MRLVCKNLVSGFIVLDFLLVWCIRLGSLLVKSICINQFWDLFPEMLKCIGTLLNTRWMEKLWWFWILKLLWIILFFLLCVGLNFSERARNLRIFFNSYVLVGWALFSFSIASFWWDLEELNGWFKILFCYSYFGPFIICSLADTCLCLRGASSWSFLFLFSGFLNIYVPWQRWIHKVLIHVLAL